MTVVKSSSSPLISLSRIVGTVSKISSWISWTAIILMMVFVAYDVVARYFGHPTSGSNDVVQVLTLMSITFAFSYTQLIKRNPSTSFLVMHLSRKTQNILETVTSLFGLIPFVLLIWTSSSMARHMLNTHEGTMTLGIPLYPLVYAIAFGSLLMCLVLIVDFLASLQKVVQR